MLKVLHGTYIIHGPRSAIETQDLLVISNTEGLSIKLCSKQVYRLMSPSLDNITRETFLFLSCYVTS